jgi:predicted hotdog family 3-hydroxylacyl-ACP dehydratase
MAAGMDRDPQSYIRHRPPVLCLDTVLEVDATRASTARTVPSDATCDGRLWEPWLIEGMAQTAAVLNGANQRAPARPAGKGMLVGVRNFDVLRAPATGETIRFEIELIKRIAPLSLMHGRALVGDELVASGELKFYVEAAG